jgi:nucleotide-binding universal stress UspA family protein
MFQKILVPLDGSALAESILPQVERIYKVRDASIVLLRVVPVPEKRSAGTDEMVRRAEGETFDYLTALQSRLETRGILTSVVVKHGMPADVIPAYAEAEEIDLITMSTHGRTGISRWTRGSVAERVLRSTGVPLLLLHSFERPGTETSPARPAAELRFARILVPVDGSAESESVLEHARALAELYESELTVFHAVYVHPALGMYPADMLPVTRTEETSFVEKLVEDLRARGIRARGKIVRGEPAWEILEQIKSAPYDLIAMATHGRSGFQRFLLGSVAEKLLRTVTLPMLLVRAASALAGEAASTSAEAPAGDPARPRRID